MGRIEPMPIIPVGNATRSMCEQGFVKWGAQVRRGIGTTGGAFWVAFVWVRK